MYDETPVYPFSNVVNEIYNFNYVSARRMMSIVTPYDNDTVLVAPESKWSFEAS